MDVCVRNLGRGVEGGVGRSANKKIPEPKYNMKIAKAKKKKKKKNLKEKGYG